MRISDWSSYVCSSDLGPFVTRHHVADGVVAHVAHVDLSRRVGEHLEHVVLLPRRVFLHGKAAGSVPALLPLFLGFLGVVTVHVSGMATGGGRRAGDRKSVV